MINTLVVGLHMVAADLVLQEINSQGCVGEIMLLRRPVSYQDPEPPVLSSRERQPWENGSRKSYLRGTNQRVPKRPFVKRI